MQIPLFKITNHSPKKLYQPPTDDLKNLLINELQCNFDKLIENDKKFSDIITSLKNKSSCAVVFGGWVRDHIMTCLSNQKFQPRDIDIVVDHLSVSQLQQLLPSGTQINIFDGFSTNTSFISLDIWLLENTFLVKELNLPLDFSTLPKTTVFRINSIVFQPRQLWNNPGIIEFGAIDAIQEKVLDFQCQFIPFPEIQVARTLIYAAKLNLEIASEVIDFIKAVCVDRNTTLKIKEGLYTNCPNHLLATAMSLFENIVTTENEFNI